MQYLHTMIRVSDLDASLDFYCDKLGLVEVNRYENEGGRFTLAFLAAPEDVGLALGRKAPLIELTYNWESDSRSTQYHNGNSSPRGFGHIGISVPDVYAACDWFKQNGVEFVKQPDDGVMKGLAFIKDPDGYWIEILESESCAHLCLG